MCRIDLEERRLYFEGERFEPSSGEGDLAGFCSFCGGELSSLALYQVSEGWMVAARCSECERMILARYDGSWSWKEDTDLVAAEPERSEKEGARRSSISEISREELEVVFTPAELRDMERFERGEVYTRQNIYRARAKYDKFERLFGVK
ncbi:hypothetical protein, partial [Methanocrinis sp.]|uniref:hypothetical protein n=1 Tax=Methanocrinis sp. TaxID=3101522 RepID=UPI003D096D42